MQIDLILQPHFAADEVARLSALAESVGIHGVWATNHLDGRDPFVNFTPLATQTTQLHMGLQPQITRHRRRTRSATRKDRRARGQRLR